MLDNFEKICIAGTAAVIAITAVLPFDFIKVNAQCAAEGSKSPRISSLQLASKIYRQQGILAFYRGLDSAILRQGLYFASLIIIKNALVDREREKTGRNAPFFKEIIYSTIAGGISGFIANPCDLALVRLQTDHTLPPQLRRNYKNGLDALLRIPKEEGILAYWRGGTPTALRSAALSFGMIAPYDQIKAFLGSNDILASAVAAIFTCIISLPFDNIKTKYQRMTKGIDGKYPYKGFLDCLSKSVEKEGFLGLYVGLDAYIMKAVPYITISTLAANRLIEWYILSDFYD